MHDEKDKKTKKIQGGMIWLLLYFFPAFIAIFLAFSVSKLTPTERLFHLLFALVFPWIYIFFYILYLNK